jgi:hypothetical protein
MHAKPPQQRGKYSSSCLLFSESDGSKFNLAAGVSIAVALTVLFVALLVLFVWRVRRKTAQHAVQRNDGTTAIPMQVVPGTTVSSQHHFTSGHGSDPVRLQQTCIQLSVAVQIHLEECIGSGRYSSVFRSTWQGGPELAVKVFSSSDEQSWYRETEIYDTVLSHHDNVSRFFAADMVTSETSMEP